MRVVVTGATGLIGRRLVPRLLQEGHEVHVLGRSPAPDRGAAFHQIDLVDGIDRLPIMLREIGATHAVHLAWYAEPGKYWAAPENLDWIAATLRFARCFAATGGKRLLIAGTCAEYDWSGDGRLDEFDTPLQPTTAYGTAKQTVHRLLSVHAPGLGLSLAWAHIFFPYASDERPERLLGTLIAAARTRQVARFSAGTQRRDFISAAEVAEAISRLLARPVEGAVNVGSGRAVSVREFVSQAAALLERPVELEFASSPLGSDQPATLAASIDRLVREVGFTPNSTLQPGLTLALREAGLIG